MIKQKEQWCNRRSQLHFETGVRMGFGAFNLLMSHLPGKVLRLLEFVGFSGNRLHGFRELEQSVEQDGLRSPLALLIMLCYLSYIEPIFGIGKCNVAQISKMVKSGLNKYPDVCLVSPSSLYLPSLSFLMFLCENISPRGPFSCFLEADGRNSRAV